MSDEIKLALKKRDVFGKKVKSLRKDGFIPAVLHNHGEDSIHVSVEEATMQKVYAAAGKHHALGLDVEGSKHTALIRDVDYVPAKTKMRHVVFQLVRANEKIEAAVPIELVGEIPAEKVGYQVLEQLKEVEIKALPKDLVDKIEVDASVLAEVGDTITVADLKVPAGIEILSEPEQVIATVEAMVDQVAEADAALEEMAEAEGTQPEAEHGSTEPASEPAEEDQPGGAKQFQPKGD